MTTETTKKENIASNATSQGDVKPASNTASNPVSNAGSTSTPNDPTKVFKGGPRKKNVFKGKGGKGGRRPRPKPEFMQKIVNISRVTRVVKGGRRLSFRVDMVIGDKNGKVGIGSGKAGDITIAIEKAYSKAKKNLIQLKLTDNKSIPYEVSAKFCSSKLVIMPNKGRGLVAGSTVRNVLEFAGVTDVTAKIHSRSENKLNNAKATFKALEEFKTKLVKKEEKKEEEKKTWSRDGSPKTTFGKKSEVNNK